MPFQVMSTAACDRCKQTWTAKLELDSDGYDVREIKQPTGWFKIPNVIYPSNDPHIICNHCKILLTKFLNGEKIEEVNHAEPDLRK